MMKTLRAMSPRGKAILGTVGIIGSMGLAIAYPATLLIGFTIFVIGVVFLGLQQYFEKG